MARKRKSYRRARVSSRSYFRPKIKRRSSNRGMFGMGQEISAVVKGGAYGAVRGKLASFAVPQLAKIPMLGGLMSSYGDEAGMALALWGIGKLKPGLKKYTIPALMCEGFSAGKTLVGNM